MDERLQRVLDLRADGLTFRAIAAAIGISPQRAHQLYRKAAAVAESGLVTCPACKGKGVVQNESAGQVLE